MFWFVGSKSFFLVNALCLCRLVEVPVSLALGVSGFGVPQRPCRGLRLPVPQLHPHLGCRSAPSTCRLEKYMHTHSSAFEGTFGFKFNAHHHLCNYVIKGRQVR